MTESANPFAPPQARIVDPHDARVLAPARKPVAVWLMQGLVVVAPAGWLVWRVKALFAGTALSHVNLSAIASPLWGTAALAMYFGTLARDCQGRTRRGRRMGLTVIGAMLLIELLGIASETLWLTSGQANLVGAVRWLAFVLPWALVAATIAWAWRFAFTPAARSWFGVGDADAPTA